MLTVSCAIAQSCAVVLKPLVEEGLHSCVGIGLNFAQNCLLCTDRIIYGHSLVSLSVKVKLSWVMSSFGQKLQKWSLSYLGNYRVLGKSYLLLMSLSLKLLLPISVFVGEDRIDVLSEVWDHYFTETLPTLQAIFYPVQVILIIVQSGEAM